MNDYRRSLEDLARRGRRRGPVAFADSVDDAARRTPTTSRWLTRGMPVLVAAAVIIVVALLMPGSGENDQKAVAGQGESPAPSAPASVPPQPDSTTTSTDAPPATAIAEPAPTTATSTTLADQPVIDDFEPPHSTTTSTVSYASPPPAVITGTRGSADMEQGSYCWSSGPEQAGLCADTIGPGEQTPAMPASAGETLEIRWETESQPEQVSLTVQPVDGSPGPATDLAASNPTFYTVDLEPGSYHLIVFSVWEEGDTSNFVRIDVS